ncbi:MAG: hypothetical protein JNL93_03560 [Pelomonas sp.]|nr:hypothetical protein [Roseateles sp.]
MLEAINTWSDYRTKVREFDAVLEHGKAVAAAWAGAPLTTPRASYGEQIFVKLLAHCIALRRLAPDPMQSVPRELWDLPSMSALARCVIEAFDAFEYVAGHVVTESERSFRIRLWELHDATRRLKILAAIGADDPAIEGIRADARRLQQGLETHEVMAALPAELQAELRRRFTRDDPPAFHLNQRQRCVLSGIDADLYQSATMQLSQHVHTLPFSVHQLMQFQAGSPEALRLLSQPLVFALPFLARTIQTASTLMPISAPEPPSRTARTMQVWRAVVEAAQAVKAAR